MKQKVTIPKATPALLKTEKLVPSTTNPRRQPTKKELQELVDSVKTLGIVQPILVRAISSKDYFVDEVTVHAGKTPEHGFLVLDRRLIHDGAYKGPQPTRHATRKEAEAALPTHEIIAGERRWRAAVEANLGEVPCQVIEADDRLAVEIQVVENLQREDLDPWEEAIGYKELRDKFLVDVDEIAVRVGKSKGAVYHALKLLELPEAGRKALQEGKLSASVGQLIARIPSEELQAQAIEEFVEYYDEEDEPISFRAAKREIQWRLNLQLQNAPFDRKDATLVPEAGPCDKCPKRSDCNPELFDNEKRTGLCLDPACYKSKVTAHNERQKKNAAERGLQIIEGKEAEKLFSYGHLKGNAPVVDLDAEVIVGNKLKKVRDVLPKKVVEENTRLVEHGDQVLRVIDRKLATESVKSKEAKRELAPNSISDDEKKRQKAERERKEADSRMIEDVTSKVLKDGFKGGSVLPWMLKTIALGAFTAARIDNIDPTAKALGISQKIGESQEALKNYLKTEEDPAKLFEVIFRLLVASAGAFSWSSEFSTAFTFLAESRKIDLKKLRAEKLKEVRSEKKKPSAKTKEPSPARNGKPKKEKKSSTRSTKKPAGEKKRGPGRPKKAETVTETADEAVHPKFNPETEIDYEVCRKCGCTEDNACLDEKTGEPCWWVTEPIPGAKLKGLCSCCATPRQIEEALQKGLELEEAGA